MEAKLLRKLDDRSRMLVHLGTEPGSKPYRMFDPQSQKVIVSRDDVFDEKKGWNQSTNVTYQNRAGNFKIIAGVFGNHGLQETKSGEIKIEEKVADEDHEVNIEEEDNAESEDDTDETSETDLMELRRSTRISSKPKYLEDYVLLLAEEEGERLLMCLNNEPESFEEAKRYKEWLQACEAEI